MNNNRHLDNLKDSLKCVSHTKGEVLMLMGAVLYIIIHLTVIF